MRRNARNSVGVAVATALLALLMAAFGASPASAITIEKWEAGTCAVNVEPAGECTYASPAASMYTQSAGHPNFGITDFTVGDTSGTNRTKRVHVELPKGLNVNPQAVPQCPVATFQADACPAASEVGTSYVTTEAPIIGGVGPLPFAVYDLVPKEGEPALFGFHVTTPLIPAVSEFTY